MLQIPKDIGVGIYMGNVEDEAMVDGQFIIGFAIKDEEMQHETSTYRYWRPTMPTYCPCLLNGYRSNGLVDL